MVHYSVLSFNDIVGLCDQYGIQEVKSFSVLSGGSENTNYFIATENRQFVLTICEQKSIKSTRELASLLEYLGENGFKTSKVVRSEKNELVLLWDEKPVLLKEYLEGQIIENLSTPILETIGRQIGILHQIEAPSYLPTSLSYGIEYFTEVSNYATNSPFELWLKEIEIYIKPFLSEELPKSLIHSDIFFSNIVVSTNRKEARIMDFEEAAHYFRIFDIGMTLVGLCCDEDALNLSKAKALLKGYQQELDLSNLEKSSLQAFTVYAAASMAFWRHRNFNHINLNSEMFDHYLGLKVIADSIRNMSKVDFLKILD